MRSTFSLVNPRSNPNPMRAGASGCAVPLAVSNPASLPQRLDSLAPEVGRGLHSLVSLPRESAGESVISEPLEGDGQFIARSPSMQAIFERSQQLAQFDVPVLILGESGCGKEAVARLIHHHSERRHHRFLKVNCAALPDELLESELFGYEPGAFTGAMRSKPGKFELCQKGTILLDEIGEMSPMLQAKLLHVLQDHRFTRLGGRTEVYADVRVLAATNINVHQALLEKRFREDLFFRLNVFSLTLPPLRERQEDIEPLLQYNLERFAQQYGCEPRPFSPELLRICFDYEWPGNVRELENVIKRYLIFGDEVLHELHAAPRRAAAPVALAAALSPAAAAPEPLQGRDLKAIVRNAKDELERETIARVLEETRWNRSSAARVLNISYRALLNKLQRYQLRPHSYSESMRARAASPGAE